MKKYGILAYPAGHSLSPVMHNAAFEACGIEAEYGVFEVPEEGFAEFMSRVKSGEISGLSVSLPYKEKVMEFLDKVDTDGRNIGAVNTVVGQDGFLVGYNTDFIGSNLALGETLGDFSGSKVVVLGAGGASRAICYGLLKNKCEVVILNRNEERARVLARDLSKFGKISGGGLEGERKVSGEVLIQASSIWTLGGGDLGERMSQSEIDEFIPDEFVDLFEAVMDICYKPLKTPLIVKAERLKKKIITGDKMLLFQAAEQFQIWTGEKAPVEVMKKALMEYLD